MPKRADGLVMFAGPTLAASAHARTLARPFHVRPPVRRFDIAKLLGARVVPRVVVIVDGVFHDSLAVGHAEIRAALEQGVQVWGLSSMGAIRAREMAPLGMRGFGRVFARFMEDGDFQDDEVALLHEGTAPYRGLTEPLIHLRAAVDHLVAARIVEAADAAEVVRELKSRWYGDRQLRGAIEMLGARARGGEAAVRAELGDFRRFCLKTADLEQFVEARAWERTAGRAGGSEGERGKKGDRAKASTERETTE
jgi:hypothetical protein